MEQDSGDTGITGMPSCKQLFTGSTYSYARFCSVVFFGVIVVAVYCCSRCVLRLAMLHFSYSTSGAKRTHQLM